VKSQVALHSYSDCCRKKTWRYKEDNTIVQHYSSQTKQGLTKKTSEMGTTHKNKNQSAERKFMAAMLSFTVVIMKT
jgi:hypothetical protein